MIYINNKLLKNIIYVTNRLLFRNVNSSMFETKYLTNDDSGIMLLGINNPERKNAISKAFVYELDDILDEIEINNTIRVLILYSLVPGVFCSGADLKERISMSDSEVAPFVKKLRNLTLKLQHLPQPTIAALDGHALGGGLELAMSCDLLTCVTNIKLGLVETSLSIFPGAGGCQRLARLIGPLKAKELIFTSEIFNGKKAESMGLVNCSVDQNDRGDSAYQCAISLAKKIAANGPVGVKLSKFVLTHGLDIDMKTALALDEAAYSNTVPLKDRKEALLAFKEKRHPKFTGQ